MKHNRLRRRGFTLMELLTIIAIVVILATVTGIIYTACHFVSKYW